MRLQIEGLVAGYDRIAVLHAVDLNVDEGELVAVIGANGAGKTTLLRTISGLNRAYEGTLRFDGLDLGRLGTTKIAEAGIAHVPENRRVFPHHSVLENLRIGGYVRRRNTSDVAEDLERMLNHFPVLGERRTQMAGTLSGGEQQMLAIAMALMVRPKLLMLDEPSLGLAPLVVDRVFAEIRRLRDEGTTILLVEQLANRAFDVATQAVVLQLGKVIAVGDPATLRTDEAVKAAYLGA
ncbi:MAG: ABC transporter ATP-binding protein [Ilumatobacteraceae bacterium]